MADPHVLAAMAASWFDAAGFDIAFSCVASDVAREGGTAKAGLLAAAIELRLLLAKSSQGRQALRDFGFEPVAQHMEGECLGVMVSQGADDSLLIRRPDGVELALTAQEFALIRALPPYRDLQSKTVCELSSHLPSSTCGSDRHA